MWKRFWCALRGHPYPTEREEFDPAEPLILRPPWCCSNCGKQFWPGRRGMHS